MKAYNLPTAGALLALLALAGCKVGPELQSAGHARTARL